MILFGSLVQVKGFGFALVWSRKRWMASLSSRRDRNTPRLRRFFVRLAKKLSIALSQEADVGVKWKTNRRCFSSHFMTLGCLWVAQLSTMTWIVFFLDTLASMTFRKRMNS